MRRAWLLATVIAVWCAAMPAQAAGSAETSYDRALGWEKSARAGLSKANATSGAAAEARRVVSAYKRIVARYPRSGYCDNALWQAAQLSADVWSQFGEDADRREAVRLLQALVRSYPSSSLVKKARSDARRLENETRAAREDRTVPVPDPAPIAAKEPAGVEPAVKPATRPVRTTPSGADTATVRSITRTALERGERVTIELDREVVFEQDRIANPERVFVDLRNAKLGSGVNGTEKFDGGIVRQLRVGTPESKTTRVVLDIAPGVRHSLFALYAPYRLVIDLERGGSRVPAAVPASTTGVQEQPSAATDVADLEPVLPRASAPVSVADAPSASSVSPPRAAAVREAAAPVKETSRRQLPARESTPTDVAATTPAPALPSAPSANLHGSFSLSRQLGLGIARIVIDPGHGGHDPGAQGKGITESDLVLDVALRLEALLLKQPGVEVVLTRRTDVFIPLEERTAIANREDADLFLSIHANASRNRSARGVETYFLNFASNPDAQAVAARENAASGRTMHSLPDIVKAITLNDKLDESRDFATMVQRSMVRGLRPANRDLRDLGVKQAPFVVLIGAGMPSVLAEISFVTHPQEGKLLRGPAYRQRIAEALFEGVANYQRALKNIKTVANQ
jgi:N-acetylmuramoyl-L-alanine amidase